MSSPSESLDWQWQPSVWLLTGYAAVQSAALLSLWWVDIPLWALVLGVGLCTAHAGWVVPRQLALSSPAAYRGLRCTAQGWQVFSPAQGWQSIALHPDSLALPVIILLRFRLSGQRRVRSLCIARDSLSRDQHRRLRVRLKFSRHRWAAAG